MVVVNGLVWDDWNKEHINKHGVTIEEVEKACQGKHKVIETFRKRFLLIGNSKRKQVIKVILSPEDRNLKPYESGTYYVITAYKENEKVETT